MIRTDEISVIRPITGITSDNVEELKAALQPLAERQNLQVIVDLGAVDIITTPGISVLLEAAQKLRAHGGALALARPRPTVAGVLRRLRLGAVLETVDGIDQAVQLTGKAETRIG